MSFIKKYAWYGSAVVASLAFAVALLLVGPAERAEAAALTSVSVSGSIASSRLVDSANTNDEWTISFTTPTAISSR